MCPIIFDNLPDRQKLKTSIFDDNIHKYGELIIHTIDGTKSNLSKILIDSGFALYDVFLFHQELSIGNLKTKLSISKAKEVIRHLEKGDRNKSEKERDSKVKKQTAILHAAQDFETVLTTQNLEKHNRQLSGAAIDNLLEKKMKDFDRCKDIDEESMGRGLNLKHSPEDHKPSMLKKKLEFVKLQQSRVVMKERKNFHNDPSKILLATKRFLENNAVYDDETDLNTTENGPLNTSEIKTTEDNLYKREIEKFTYEDNVKNEIEKLPNTLYEETPYSKAESSNQITSPENIVKRAKKPTRSSKIPQYDIATEKRVAYGPPGFNITHLPLKVVPKEKENEEINHTSVIDDRQVVEIQKEPYGEVDSMINIQITNKDTLMESLSSVKENNVTVSEDEVKIQQAKSVENECLDISTSDHSAQNQGNTKTRSAVLQKKLKLYKAMCSKQSDNSATSHSDTTNKDSSTSADDCQPKREKKNTESVSCEYLDSDDDLAEIVEKINAKYGVPNVKTETEAPKDISQVVREYKNNVNPFKNVDDSISVFVDKLIAPVLMVHSKMDKRIEPCSNMRDVNFNTHIHIVLKNLSVTHPMMLQMISWPAILRGFSTFLVSPLRSGKTFGYLPAVCQLVTDFNADGMSGAGPTCIIVCATAQSVTEVEKLARMFLGVEKRILSCFAGMDELHMTTSLLNGCDLFICTPSVLVRLLQIVDFGVDLRRLSTCVLDDCERLSEVYANEIKFFLAKIKEMYKNRVNKELKVQFIAASRVWCDFMAPLARKAPNSVICIGAFQECVLYSKTNTVVDFVKKENKVKHVLDFLKTIDRSKKSVIVCRSDDEVGELTKVLLDQKYIVFSCNSTMTVEELYNLSKSWVEYEEPVLGPILICCDGNLTHLNVTDANFLHHYSLPHLFSMFCKRFSVLNDNYSSIFKEEQQNVKIKVLLEDSNAEQLPKILNFIKRCTDKVPEFLEAISEKILQEKDVVKGENLVPICDSLLTLGECPDFWNCLERHGVFNEHDKPKDWMPSGGVVTFKILHYHTAVHYSARLLSNSTKGKMTKYPQTFSMLHLKMGMYFSKECNRKLHGTPKVGDVCAVSVKQNFFARCQVLKILNYYNNGTPNSVLIRLLDEERLERARDIYLYYLPNDLKSIETHIVQVRLVNMRPKDNDVTFSDLAKDQLKKITDQDEELYLRGQVVMTIGNCVFVDTLDACQELTSLNETVVRYNLKKELLETHAMHNPNHLVKLNALCKDYDCGEKEMIVEATEMTKLRKSPPKPQWAHLEKNDFSLVFFCSAESPGTFFVRLTKFEACMKLLLQEIDKYVKDKPSSVADVQIGDILLAKFPDDATYERARIDNILDNEKVRCFFVDHGDWRVVMLKDLLEIPDKLVAVMPFQAIECSLVGVEPAGENWTEYGTDWFTCNCFQGKNGDIKQLYVKYFNKGKANYTNGHKYGVVLIDTTAEQDVLINQLLIELNLAQAKEDEVHFFNEIKINKPYNNTESSSDNDEVPIKKDQFDNYPTSVPVNTPRDTSNVASDSNNIFIKEPIRSMPLVNSDNESEASDKWEIENINELATAIFKTTNTAESKLATVAETIDNLPKNLANIPAIKNTPVQKANLVTPATSNFNKRNDPNITSSTLDSDDLSSAESSQATERFTKTQNRTPNVTEADELRKPKLVWRQNKSTVSIKIQLIGADDYNLVIKERSLKFSTYLNDTNYGFQIELYGVIDKKTAVHSNKGQYILVKLNKIMKKNWLTLTKDGSLKKWIVYDVDSIDTSSDEEEEIVNQLAEIVKSTHDKDRDSDSDDELLDDINYEYKRDSD
ncbi:unnamed protein product [Chilo suppressalis]|uniref:RNA helicase n=1 Tax=Chilo suppressalis TaxID=168631 RepID=A0ABN8BCN8_CHISP|nr:unnamed protein product [Chilo suppressalis]